MCVNRKKKTNVHYFLFDLLIIHVAWIRELMHISSWLYDIAISEDVDNGALHDVLKSTHNPLILGLFRQEANIREKNIKFVPQV